MKRTCRNLPDETRRKISEALKGKTKTKSHRKALSVALTRYWATIPTKDNNETENVNVTTSQSNKTCKNAR